ncbi:MAG TPA: 3-hydroxyacyl-CoA dehydrogenase family protein [Candidatus Kapabacteria bacterium]|nr:3-hydroxyacyl-CoA dehydrogenase family protein [Candidatus Kapabacteria bacterium]
MSEILLIGDPELVQEWEALLEDNNCSTLTLDEMSDLATHSYRSSGGGLKSKPPIPDFVFELFTTLDEKTAAVELLDEFIDEESVIVTNVLSATATEVASWLDDSGSVVGISTLPSMATEMPLIEVCKTPYTSEEAMDDLKTLLKRAGKEIEIVDDRIALVFARILVMVINEAAFALMEKVASREDIDRAMQLGTNYPKGPLAWADEIGLDFVVLTLESLYEEYRDERYRPCVLLKQMVRAGKIGKLEGAGFYEYGA